GSFVDSALAKNHTDLLFSIELDGARVYIYLLLEHQSSNDRHMPRRMLRYLDRIWARYRKAHPHDPLPIVVPIVVSHAPGGWTSPRDMHALFEPNPASVPELARYVPSFSIIVEDLAHLSNEQLRARGVSQARAVVAARRSRRRAAVSQPRILDVGVPRSDAGAVRHAGDRAAAALHRAGDRQRAPGAVSCDDPRAATGSRGGSRDHRRGTPSHRSPARSPARSSGSAREAAGAQVRPATGRGSGPRRGGRHRAARPLRRPNLDGDHPRRGLYRGRVISRRSSPWPC